MIKYNSITTYLLFLLLVPHILLPAESSKINNNTHLTVKKATSLEEIGREAKVMLASLEKKQLPREKTPLDREIEELELQLKTAPNEESKKKAIQAFEKLNKRLLSEIVKKSQERGINL
jgi:hypothetical protein